MKYSLYSWRCNLMFLPQYFLFLKIKVFPKKHTLIKRKMSLARFMMFTRKNTKNKIIGHYSSRWHWRNWMSLTDFCFHVTFSVCNGCWLSAWQYIFARNYCGNSTRENCCQFGIVSSLIHDDDKDPRAIMQNKFFKEELNEWKCLSFTWNIILSITWFPRFPVHYSYGGNEDAIPELNLCLELSKHCT